MGEREKREGREIRERGREIVYEERYLMTGVTGRLYREREREKEKEREREREREIYTCLLHHVKRRWRLDVLLTNYFQLLLVLILLYYSFNPLK